MKLERECLEEGMEKARRENGMIIFYCTHMWNSQKECSEDRNLSMETLMIGKTADALLECQ